MALTLCARSVTALGPADAALTTRGTRTRAAGPSVCSRPTVPGPELVSTIAVSTRVRESVASTHSVKSSTTPPSAPVSLASLATLFRNVCLPLLVSFLNSAFYLLL